ncbi:MAG: type II toxin-antitoxin system VapC family toxin [Deltaproteobacteria bacterium]|nr:type II toxin-antitoxin system VapC family toxin [Deltaproteobacteria bacterium]
MTAMFHYLDTSAIVKLFEDEEGSKEVRQYFWNPNHSVFYTTFLCLGETLGVLKRKFVKQEISQDKYLESCDDLMSQIRDESICIDEISIVDRNIYSEVDTIADTYSLDIADAFQIITLKRGALSRLSVDLMPLLITADEALCKAARGEKLRVWDCLREPAPSS